MFTQKTVIVIVICIAALIGYWMYLEGTRYSISVTGEGRGFQLDKKTGKTWVLYHGRKGESQSYQPENK